MSALPWIVAAVLIGFLFAVIALRGTLRLVTRGRRARAEAGGDAGGPTQLQKLAWSWLLIGLAMAVPLVIGVVVLGPTTLFAEAGARLPLMAVLGVGFVLYGLLLLVARRRIAKGRVVMDERDEEILARAPRAQAAAILVVLAAWTIGLTEAYWEAGQVPIAYLFVIFWSILIVAALALPIGILIGYWSE